MSVGDAVAAEDAAARTASYLYSPCPYAVRHNADQLSLSLRSLAHSLAYHLPVIAIGPWRVHTHVTTTTTGRFNFHDKFWTGLCRAMGAIELNIYQTEN